MPFAWLECSVGLFLRRVRTGETVNSAHLAPSGPIWHLKHPVRSGPAEAERMCSRPYLRCNAFGSRNGRGSLEFELDGVVRRIHEILFRPQVALRRLHRRVPQKQLDLFQLPAGCAAQLGAAAPAMPHAA